MPYLFFYRSGQELLYLDLGELVTAKQPLVFGSKAGNYVMPDPEIAPTQLEIAAEGSGYRLNDRSGKGTWVKGHVVPTALLGDGDSFRLGSFQVLYYRDLPEGFGGKEGPRTQIDPFKPAPLPEALWIVAQPKGGGKQLRVPFASRAVIGSGEGCDLRLPGDTVSAQHLELTREGDTVRARDLGSTNHTWLGPIEIGTAGLPLGTRLRAGEWEIWVTAQDGAIEGPRAVAMACGLVTSDPGMLALLAQVDLVAGSDATVFIEGESGTGKELLAKVIHERSKRAAKTFITLNCGLGRSAEGFSAQLSGFRKGSFTGADRDEPGTLAAADGGTVFLDEVKDVPFVHQVALLRAVENGEIHPHGDPAPRRVDVRFIAATNYHLGRAIRAGEFREDLYHRISVVKLKIPPLRARMGDVPILFEFFCRKFSGSYTLELTEAALAKLMAYHWPGNVRELGHVAYRAMLFTKQSPCTEAEIIFDENLAGDEDEAPAPPATADAGTAVYPRGKSLSQIEAEWLTAVMLDNKGVRRAACRQLGIDMKRLLRMLEEHGLQGVGLGDES